MMVLEELLFPGISFMGGGRSTGVNTNEPCKSD